MKQMRVLHIISGLGSGGAEWMLYRLLSTADPDEVRSEVISLSSTEPLGERIKELGIPVSSVGFGSSFPSPAAWRRLARGIRDFCPDVIQTWMYHADLAAGVIARVSNRAPIVWGLHHTTIDSATTKARTSAIARLCAHLSHCIPRRIVCCSEATRESHTALGYDREKLVVIPNGFDTSVFRPDAAARAAVRNELGLEDRTPLVGLVARYHPLKDHANMILAAARLRDSMPAVRFLLCGAGVDRENEQLTASIAREQLAECTHLLGLRDDVPRLLAALDIAVSSSSSEALPLVVGEAMACGIPCVVTDVGDSSLIVGNSGRVVPPQDPEALAWAIAELLKLDAEERVTLGAAARRRIETRYSLGAAAAGYMAVYRELVRTGA